MPADGAQATETAEVHERGRAQLGARWDELVAAARDDDLEDTLRGVVGAATSLTA
jgi:hypothetical protein